MNTTFNIMSTCIIVNSLSLKPRLIRLTFVFKILKLYLYHNNFSNSICNYIQYLYTY